MKPSGAPRGLHGDPVDGLGLPPAEAQALIAVSGLPWAIKPLYGVLCDAVPLFGTHRKGYLGLMGLYSVLTVAVPATAAERAYTQQPAAWPIAAACAAFQVYDTLVSLYIKKLRKAAFIIHHIAVYFLVTWGAHDKFMQVHHHKLTASLRHSQPLAH